jgi:tetratricopeptide (TPR) repeat protein
MLKFFKTAYKKKLDNTRINTYTTLADFYIKNGYQKEARSTLEDMARYYDSIGYEAESKKALLLAAQIGSSNKTVHIEKYFSDITGQPGEKQCSPQHSENPEHNRVAVERNTDNTSSTAPAADFFDLENALTENDSYAFSAMPAGLEPPFLNQRDNASPEPHAAIFREIKLSTENSWEENSLDFHYTMGIAQQKLRRFDGAIEEFTAALVDIKNATAHETSAGATAGDCYLQIVTCYDALNKQAKAAQYARRALTLNSLTAEQRLFFKEFIAGSGNTTGEHGLCFFLARQLVQIKSALCRLCNNAII